jgi:hypothetical protein
MGDVLGAAGAPAGEPGAAVGDGAVPLYPILRDFPPLPPLREALELPPRGPVRAAVAGDDGAGAPPAAGDDDDGGAALPGLGDGDGDAALVGGARSAIEADLIKEAVNPMDDGWDRIQAAITNGDLPPALAKGVLAGVLQGLAKWDLPNIKAFLNRKFKLGDEEITVDVNYPGEFGETALMQAAVNGRVQAAATLLEAGANPNAQNKDGETALMWAAAYNELEMIKLLLDSGASTKLKDSSGWTALMVAAWAGRPEAVELLKPKSSTKDTTKEGLEIWQLAADSKSPSVAYGKQTVLYDMLRPVSIRERIAKTFRRKKGGRNVTQRRKKTNSKKRSRR